MPLSAISEQTPLDGRLDGTYSQTGDHRTKDGNKYNPHEVVSELSIHSSLIADTNSKLNIANADTNPFLKYSGKEASSTECPKAHSLKLFVSPLGKPCAVCGDLMPNGDRAWRCFPCDFHICIPCHESGAKYSLEKYTKAMETYETVISGSNNCNNTANAGVIGSLSTTTMSSSRSSTITESTTSSTSSGPPKLAGVYRNPHWNGSGMTPFADIEKQDVTMLKELVVKYAENPINAENTKENSQGCFFRLMTVNCKDVIPDYSNRGHTGLSVEHVHKVAQSMAKGFKNRDLEDQFTNTNKGFDIPVLVRETNLSEGGILALENWKNIVQDQMSTGSGFPAPSIHLLRKKMESPMYCSLGNGHFYQALNLFRNEKVSIWTKKNDLSNDFGQSDFVEKYELDIKNLDEIQKSKNPELVKAVLKGVPALILRNDCPLNERIKICELLNKKSDYRWPIKEGPDYNSNPHDLIVDLENMREVDVQQSQFELLSKVLDGMELNCLVRQEVGQSGSERVGR